MKKLIIDTDLCFDCDDALAIAIANIAKNKQYIDLLAITHCLSDTDCVDVIYQINEYYGNKHIVLGVSKNSKVDCDEGKEYFINAITKCSSERDFPSSTDVILDKLLENEGCTLVFIGLQNNLAYILQHKDSFYKGKKIHDIYILLKIFYPLGEHRGLFQYMYMRGFFVLYELRNKKHVWRTNNESKTPCRH